MPKFLPALKLLILVISGISANDASQLQAVDTASNELKSTDQKRQSGQITIIDGGPDPPPGLLYLDGPPMSLDDQIVTVDDGIELVSGDDPSVVLAVPPKPVLEPLQLPPVVDVYPEVPDRVGDTPLQVQTVIEAEPNSDEQPLEVPWVWDDKVCSPLLNRPPPPAACNVTVGACAKMKGWFDAFRTDGGPTLYHHSNRTAVTGDVSTIVIGIVFITVLVAFLLIFPGVRNQRFTTFTCVILSLITGVAITLGATGSDWQTGTVQINTYYRAFSSDSLHADLGVHIGLSHVNVTLKALPSSRHSEDIDFNERFQWAQPLQMRNEYRGALIKGLPYPILTVAEYLSTNSEGFLWGQKLRVAGYYTNIIIWTAFASWLLMNLLLINVPRYGAYLMVITGSLMCGACGLYTALKPTKHLAIRFEDAVLEITLGWQFYLVLVAGVLCMIFGITAALVDLVYPHIFSTILEVDFGTPYDRHILIVESEESRHRRTIKIPKLEEPINAGIEATTKLIRRLSKRGKDGASTDPRGGVDNVAFEMDQTKPPLHAKLSTRNDSKKSSKSFSFRRGPQHLDVPAANFDLPPNVAGKTPLERTDSKLSNASSMSINSVPRASLPDGEHPSFSEQFRRARRPDSRRDSAQSSDSNTSSMYGGGASVLSRAGSSRGSGHFLSVPVETCPSGGAGGSLHPPLEKRDSRASNIIVFHTQDARGQLTRRHSTDPVPDV